MFFGKIHTSSRKQTHIICRKNRTEDMHQDPPSSSNPNNINVNGNANVNMDSSHITQLPPVANVSPPSTTTSSSSTSIFIRNGACGGNGIIGGSQAHNNQPHNNHRRAHSEVSFRMPDDLMDLLPSDPFNGGGSSTASFEEIGSEDDLFSTYIDIDKLGGGVGPNGLSDQSGNGNANNSAEGDKSSDPSPSTSANARPRHRHSYSVDGLTSNGMFGEIMEAKKAMPPDKLAELWTIDPKRAKRILANRQSASRSKERKARYIQELERKVQTLQTEATTLSAQLTLFQRDTTGLSNENTELKLRLQAMEQQAQLCDALNEALKKEVERLKLATGDMMNPSESFNMGMPQMPFPGPNFFPLQPHAGVPGQRNMQMPPFRHSQPNMAHQMHQSSYSLPDIMQNDQLGRLQGLDISSNGSPLVKSEAPSFSASESSTTF